jgi:hypothetical protein
MNRARVRSALFGYALDRYFGQQKTQIQQALAALSPEHRH